MPRLTENQTLWLTLFLVVAWIATTASTVASFIAAYRRKREGAILDKKIRDLEEREARRTR